MGSSGTPVATNGDVAAIGGAGEVSAASALPPAPQQALPPWRKSKDDSVAVPQVAGAPVVGESSAVAAASSAAASLPLNRGISGNSPSAAEVLRQGEALLRQVQTAPPKAPSTVSPPLDTSPAEVLRRGEELLRQSAAVNANIPKQQSASLPSGLPASSPSLLSPTELLRRGEELMASVTAQAPLAQPGQSPSLAQQAPTPTLVTPPGAQVQPNDLPPWKRPAPPTG